MKYGNTKLGIILGDFPNCKLRPFLKFVIVFTVHPIKTRCTVLLILD